MKIIANQLSDYLQASKYIDWDNPCVSEKAKELARGCLNEIQIIEKCYHFVRDKIKHSWDVQDKRVTAKASQVLKEGVGICWAKSNLFAALLRKNGIPAGICYQRLTLGDTPESGYCLHALNAVYISGQKKWIRLDARGNKEGVNAQLSLDKEQLAFPVRVEYDEIDYEEIYAKPVPKTMKILEKSTDALYLCRYCLPERL